MDTIGYQIHVCTPAAISPSSTTSKRHDLAHEEFPCSSHYRNSVQRSLVNRATVEIAQVLYTVNCTSLAILITLKEDYFWSKKGVHILPHPVWAHCDIYSRTSPGNDVKARPNICNHICERKRGLADQAG